MFLRTAPRRGFTLIELLIVVAIIAILAAIAVPNFLEAQTRAKVSRVKADMRSIATAVESYYVDTNRYPTGWGILVNQSDDNSHSLFLLSTPIAYLSSANIQDPFVDKQDDTAMYTTIQWDPMTEDGRMMSAYNASLSYVSLTELPTWWILFSQGPDLKSGFGDWTPTGAAIAGDPESNVQVRIYNADSALGDFMDTVYDPTNGTVSVGNLYRAGGSGLNSAGRIMAGGR